MTPRLHLSRRQRTRIYDAADGICHICNLPIHAERGTAWEVEHKTPLWAGGKDDESNMAPAHLDPCHREKTAEEAPIRAKTDRVRANHLGIPRAASSKKLPAGRNSNIKKKINGEVVERPQRYAGHHELMDKLYGGFE